MKVTSWMSAVHSQSYSAAHKLGILRVRSGACLAWKPEHVFPSKAWAGGAVLAKWASRAIDAFCHYKMVWRALAGAGARRGEGSPPAPGRGSRAARWPPVLSGPSAGSRSPAAALQLGLASSAASWNRNHHRHACAWPQAWLATDCLGLPGPHPGPGPVPAPGWTRLLATVWAGDLGQPCSPGRGAGPCPTGTPPLGAPALTGAGPGCLRLVFCKASSPGSSHPAAGEVARMEGMVLSVGSCVSVFWFRYWLPGLPALKFHLEGHEDEQSYGAEQILNRWESS